MNFIKHFVNKENFKTTSKFVRKIVKNVKKKILFGIPHMEAKKIGDSMII